MLFHRAVVRIKQIMRAKLLNRTGVMLLYLLFLVLVLRFKALRFLCTQGTLLHACLTDVFRKAKDYN